MEVKTPSKLKRKRKIYFGMTVVQIIFLAICSALLLLVLGFMVFLFINGFGIQVKNQPPEDTQPGNEALEVIINIPFMLGKSLDEIRTSYNVTLYEEIHPLLGYEDITPQGTLSEGYTTGEYSFYCFFDKTKHVIGFQVYDGFSQHRIKVSDWEKVFPLFNLFVKQPPDFINEYRAEWNSISDYNIELVRDISGDYISTVIVIRK